MCAFLAQDQACPENPENRSKEAPCTRPDFFGVASADQYPSTIQQMTSHFVEPHGLKVTSLARNIGKVDVVQPDG